MTKGGHHVKVYDVTSGKVKRFIKQTEDVGKNKQGCFRTIDEVKVSTYEHMIEICKPC